MSGVRLYHLVIFDFDGTLADSAEWFASVFNEVARRWRFRGATRAELEAMRGLDIRRLMHDLGVPRWKLPFISRDMRTMMARDIAHIRPFPGAVALLHDLAAAGVGLALVSSNARGNVEAVLGADTARLFRLTAYGASAFGKAAKFRQVMRRAGLPPARCIAVGDEVRDIDAAQAAGLAIAAVGWGYATPDALAARQPTALVGSLAELRRLLLPDGGSRGTA